MHFLLFVPSLDSKLTPYYESVPSLRSPRYSLSFLSSLSSLPILFKSRPLFFTPLVLFPLHNAKTPARPNWGDGQRSIGFGAGREREGEEDRKKQWATRAYAQTGRKLKTKKVRKRKTGAAGPKGTSRRRQGQDRGPGRCGPGSQSRSSLHFRFWPTRLVFPFLPSLRLTVGFSCRPRRRIACSNASLALNSWTSACICWRCLCTRGQACGSLRRKSSLFVFLLVKQSLFSTEGQRHEKLVICICTLNSDSDSAEKYDVARSSLKQSVDCQPSVHANAPLYIPSALLGVRFCVAFSFP